MKKAYCNGQLIWDSVSVADTIFKRFRGLLGKRRILPNEALLITPCNQIHTLHMRFAIDIIYLTKDYHILNIETAPPGRICGMVKDAYHVLEAQSGCALKNKVKPGDKLTITQ